ncbi:MAG: serine/threonine protein kinase [Planctomycetaceae bacterium]|nr:serine/threonine protein kinase [Planctomycetales bacterium]MCB9923445.1 serine/threonine protein kinase [Planctomycetaceae bacterium]
MEPTDREQASTDSAGIGETAMLGVGADASFGQKPKVRMPGDTFGRYKILKTLGEGAMGSVYLAHDTQLDRKVALKIPKFDAKSESKHIDRFLREARSAATLNHPNICQVFDVGETDGTHFMTMAYIAGHTLQDFVNPEKPQRDRNVANVVRKIALALHEAHINGLVHRDVKPGNIMIDPRNEPIVMDFGLARQIDEDDDARLTRDGAILGSPAYMSPEQIEGKSDKLGPHSDIYSLGIILYELLTGNLPFQGSVAAIIGQILAKEPDSPLKHRPDMSSRLAAICTKAMAKKPKDRYSSMLAMANDLMEFLKSKPEDETKAKLERTGPKVGERKKSGTDTDAGLKLNTTNISATCLCGQRLVAKKEMAGKTVRCPRCSNPISLPGPVRIEATCRHCGQQFMANEDLAGKVVKCPMCTRPITVPVPGGSQVVTPQIEVSCSCGQQFVATRDLAGRKVKCTACGSAIVVPSVRR